MPGSHKAFILCHREQSIEVSEHSVLWITLSQAAENLCGDGPVVVVFVSQVRKQIIPDFICPVDRSVGGFKDMGKGSVLRFSIC